LSKQSLMPLIRYTQVQTPESISVHATLIHIHVFRQKYTLLHF
jgi:hypothetical protein